MKIRTREFNEATFCAYAQSEYANKQNIVFTDTRLMLMDFCLFVIKLLKHELEEKDEDISLGSRHEAYTHLPR